MMIDYDTLPFQCENTLVISQNYFKFLIEFELKKWINNFYFLVETIRNDWKNLMSNTFDISSEARRKRRRRLYDKSNNKCRHRGGVWRKFAKIFNILIETVWKSKNQKMSAFLEFIEMDNFKSYKGNVCIGPLKEFTAVIGPNGSGLLFSTKKNYIKLLCDHWTLNYFFPGKSNFMDAISFVMGEKTSVLRVKRLSDLIHGAAIGRPVANSCSVTAKFLLSDGSRINFQRSVMGSSSDYKINGSVSF